MSDIATFRAPFNVGVTRDCLAPGEGRPIFDPAALAALNDVPGLAWEFLPEHRAEILPEDAARYDAIVDLLPRVTARSLTGGRVRLIAKFGSGFDNVDVAACTHAGVLVTNTPDGVARPVATAILTLILALAGKLMVKDRITRGGRWAERTNHMGEGLTGKIVGSIGFGNIAREAFRLLRPLDMRQVAYSPRLNQAEAVALGVRAVDFETLLRESDFVCINCPLTTETRHLIGARELGLMKPTAYLINTARGPIVDEAALTDALKERRIAGAALDVFEQEPTPPDNPILKLDNVIVTPHSLCWTDECFRLIAESAIASVIAVAAGQRPAHPVNPEALDHPRWRK